MVETQQSKATREELQLQQLEAVVRPVLSAHGVELFSLSLRRERPGLVLRVLIDRVTSTDAHGGISVDLCADVSRDLSTALDVSDVIHHAYQLEVSSPGIERPLRHAGDYQRFVGHLAKLALEQSIADGRRVVRGRIVSVEGERVRVSDEAEREIEVVLANVTRANLVFEAPAQPKKKGQSKQKRRSGSGR